MSKLTPTVISHGIKTTDSKSKLYSLSQYGVIFCRDDLTQYIRADATGHEPSAPTPFQIKSHHGTSTPQWYWSPTKTPQKPPHERDKELKVAIRTQNAPDPNMIELPKRMIIHGCCCWQWLPWGWGVYFVRNNVLFGFIVQTSSTWTPGSRFPRENCFLSMISVIPVIFQWFNVVADDCSSRIVLNNENLNHWFTKVKSKSLPHALLRFHRLSDLSHSVLIFHMCFWRPPPFLFTGCRQVCGMLQPSRRPLLYVLVSHWSQRWAEEAHF